MLVLSRKRNESIVVPAGDAIVKVLKSARKAGINLNALLDQNETSTAFFEALKQAGDDAKQPDMAGLVTGQIEIFVTELRGDKVRLGVNADRALPVHRREVQDSIERGMKNKGDGSVV